jgi:hypothetical protein
MVGRMIVILVCLGILSTVTGCAVGPSPFPSGTLAPYWTLGSQETSQGPDHERQIDEAVQKNRQRRSEQEQAQERAYQQWEPQHDPPYDWMR